MLRPLYKLAEEFPSLRDKCFAKIREIELTQAEARRAEAFPLRPIFPPPLTVIRPEITEVPPSSESRSDSVVILSEPEVESAAAVSVPMSISEFESTSDSFKEAMDYSLHQDLGSDIDEVSDRSSSHRDASTSHWSPSVEEVGPTVAIPAPIDVIPLTGYSGSEF